MILANVSDNSPVTHTVNLFSVDNATPETTVLESRSPRDLLVPVDFMFYLIHGCAVASLSLSAIVSLATLGFLISSGTERNIWKRRLSERLVIYLAVIDLIFSIDHCYDHAYPMLLLEAPGPVACSLSSFLLFELTAAQGVIVCFSAFSAFLMITAGRRIKLGPYDCGLWLTTLTIPGIPAAIFLALSYTGDSGYWCFADALVPESKIMYDILAVLLFTMATLDIVFYIGVWIKIKRTTSLFKGTESESNRSQAEDKYAKTARILTLFVAVYLAQWWPLLLLSAWGYIAAPPIALVVIVSLFCNMGGVYNFIAYTFIRRKLRASSQASHMMESKSITNMTSVKSDLHNTSLPM